MNYRNTLAALFLAATLASPALSADFSLSPDGTTIIMDGEIAYRDAEKFIDLYNSAPKGAKPTTVQLTSLGGSLVDGMDIGVNISDFGLNTITEGFCGSACAYIWIAGVKRTVHLSDSIAWHKPGIDKARVNELTKQQAADLTEEALASAYWYFGRVGVPLQATQFFLSVDNSSAMFTDPATLMMMGAATNVVQDDDRG